MEKRPARFKGGPVSFLLGFFFFFYTLTNAGWYKAGDEFFMIQVARQMVTKGQIGFELSGPPQDPFSDDYMAKGPDGRYYTKWGLGQSLVEIPFIFLHRLTTSVHLPTPIGGGLPGAPYTRMDVPHSLPFSDICHGMCSSLWFRPAARLLRASRYGLEPSVWPMHHGVALLQIPDV